MFHLCLTLSDGETCSEKKTKNELDRCDVNEPKTDVSDYVTLINRAGINTYVLLSVSCDQIRFSLT